MSPQADVIVLLSGVLLGLRLKSIGFSFPTHSPLNELSLTGTSEWKPKEPKIKKPLRLRERLRELRSLQSQIKILPQVRLRFSLSFLSSMRLRSFVSVRFGSFSLHFVPNSRVSDTAIRLNFVYYKEIIWDEKVL
jgi:hypothetical protein